MARSPWPAIVGYYLIGVLAAAQLGKMSALAPLIAAELGLSLTTAAAAVSLLEVGGATLGLVAGLLAARLGLRRTLVAAVSLLALAGLGSGFAQGSVSLLGWRLLEALGYLGVIVTAPVLIVRVATPAAATGVAMALWSSFVPVGLALGAGLWAGVAAASSWRVALWAGGAVALGALIATAVAQRMARSQWAADSPSLSAAPSTELSAGSSVRSPAAPSVGSSAGASVGPSPGVATSPSVTGPVPRPAHAATRAGASTAAWYLATSFGCYALFEVGLLALLPLYLTSQAGASVAEAGRWTALASLATIAGSATAAWLMRSGVALRLPMLISLILPAALLFPVFVDKPDATQVGWLAVLLNAVSGIYPSLAFAWLPQMAGGIQRLARANGLFSQFGASGSLLGPPLLAACVDRFGWPAAAWCGVLVTVPCVWLALKAIAESGAATGDAQL